MRIERFGRRAIACFLVLCLPILAGCGLASRTSESVDGVHSALPVVVSIAPLASLVERIGGDLVHADILVAPGQGPHTFTPKPKQIMALGEAAVYFHVGGFAFEGELADRIQSNFPELVVCNASEGIDRTQTVLHLHADEHGGDDAHDHDDGADPHVWMAPPQLMVMAENIAEALQAVDGGHAAAYEKNLNAVKSELAELHTELAELLQPYKGRTFYIYHPALGYFAETYGLEQESVEVGGQKPTPRQLQRLIEHAKEDKVRIIFVQPQFDQRSAEAVADAIDGKVVPLDPLREDVFTNLREIARRMADVFSAEDPS